MKSHKAQQIKSRKVREARKVIVSFRLRQSEADLLMEELRRQPVAGVKSLKQYARKLTIDHALRKTVYIDPLDSRISPESRQNMSPRPSNCLIPDTQFRRHMAQLLSKPENWNQLRLFVLLSGWPQAMAERYYKAHTDLERLNVARRVLRGMNR